MIRELHPGETHLAHAAMAEFLPAFVDDLESFVTQVDDILRPLKYRIFAAFDDNHVDAIAVAGFRPVTSLSWGPILHISELVTRERGRRRGHGTALVNAVSAEAVRLGCSTVHLNTAHHRYDAHRFYLNLGFEIRGYFMVRPVTS